MDLIGANKRAKVNLKHRQAGSAATSSNETKRTGTRESRIMRACATRTSTLALIWCIAEPAVTSSTISS